MIPEDRLQGMVAVEDLVVLEELLFLTDRETWNEWRKYLLEANQRLKVPTRIQIWNEWRLKKAEQRREGKGKGALEGVAFMCKLCRAVERSMGGAEPKGGSQMPKDRSGRNENESHESKMSRAWESQRKRDNENDKREGRDVRAGDALRKHYQDKGDMPEDR